MTTPPTVFVLHVAPEDMMPDGRPAPALLTADEAVSYLRLDQGQADPQHALRRYAADYGIRTVQMGKATRYPLHELKEFVRKKYSNDNGGAAWPAPPRKV